MVLCTPSSIRQLYIIASVPVINQRREKYILQAVVQFVILSYVGHCHRMGEASYPDSYLTFEVLKDDLVQETHLPVVRVLASAQVHSS